MTAHTFMHTLKIHTHTQEKKNKKNAKIAGIHVKLCWFLVVRLWGLLCIYRITQGVRKEGFPCKKRQVTVE